MSNEPRLYHPNLVITTPRLILRDTSDSDECCAALFRIRSDPRVLKMVNSKPPERVEGMKMWIHQRLSRPNTFSFVVELRNPADPSLIGTGMNIVGSCGGNRTPEFGYSMDAEHWGKGYAVEAMRAAIDAFWDTWPNGMPSLPEDRRNVIFVRIVPDNQASLAVARKLGFSLVGEEIADTTGGALDGAKVLRFQLHRPATDRPRAYEKIEVVGPNLCEGPAV